MTWIGTIHLCYALKTFTLCECLPLWLPVWVCNRLQLQTMTVSITAAVASFFLFRPVNYIQYMLFVRWFFLFCLLFCMCFCVCCSCTRFRFHFHIYFYSNSNVDSYVVALSAFAKEFHFNRFPLYCLIRSAQNVASCAELQRFFFGCMAKICVNGKRCM